MIKVDRNYYTIPAMDPDLAVIGADLSNAELLQMLAKCLLERQTAPAQHIFMVGRRESGRSKILDLHNYIMSNLESGVNGLSHATDSKAAAIVTTPYPEEVD